MSVVTDMVRLPVAGSSRGGIAVWLLFTAVSFLVAPLPAVAEEVAVMVHTVDDV